MPVIIAATDFTDAAANAVHYACKMAVEFNADIVVLHTFLYPIMFSDVPIPAPMIDEQKAAEAQMEQFTDHLRAAYPGLTISSKIIYGDIQDGIEEYAEANTNPLLVVIGNGYTQENPAWMESALMLALRHLEYPLLAVPADAAYKGVQKICFAYDNKYAGSDVALIKLRELSSFFNTRLTVLMAQTNPSAGEYTNIINPGAKTILEQANPEYNIVHGTHIDEAISDHLAQYATDWLAVMPRRHSFFANLFHKSHTEVIINNVCLPVLALHES